MNLSEGLVGTLRISTRRLTLGDFVEEGQLLLLVQSGLRKPGLAPNDRAVHLAGLS